MRWILLVLALAIGGCGGDDPSVDGAWTLRLDSACLITTVFNVSDGRYASALSCSLEGGGFGSELEQGAADYSVPRKIYVSPRKASCPTSDHTAGTVDYSFSGNDQLNLMTPEGVLVYERTPTGGRGGGSAVIRFGCWDNGLFTDSPLQDL